jgi:hypothetical protein
VLIFDTESGGKRAIIAILLDEGKYKSTVKLKEMELTR